MQFYSACPNNVELPGDIDDMCLVLQQRPEFLLVPEQYQFQYIEENWYLRIIKAANSIYEGEMEEFDMFCRTQRRKWEVL